ncbi:hypothetical protein [Mucilaginibacter sp. FT3.2]|uniref:hypothetical protein n=1 Tax=Mucilaginibacter sp. FT3.2 TaxID=2723090 RepID=UPI00161935EE|nr:hypothetical protein [Mucilaginibacter sp. FT3.2]MBB6230630.1 hypothetical protein [Mucilaginibacter sp. FT3.2]
MSFIIKGNLRGLLCSDCEIPVSGTSVKVYKPFDRVNETRLAVADAKQTFHQVSDAELKEKEKLFIAEAVLHDNGDFVIETGERGDYDGGAVDIDWYCGNNPIKIGPGPKKDLSLQFHITTLQPAFKQTDDSAHVAFFEYKIDSKWFCRILTLLDIWVVCGVVADCETKKPIAGVKVFAYDVDLIQDDFLGSAYTDNNGKFTIVYPGANFRQTLLSPFLNVEWPAGPDYYFRVESSSGAILLQEDRTRGRQADRHNAHNCFCVKLCIKDGGIYTQDVPWFTAVGNFNITSDIDASGQTLVGKFGAGGVGFGFFGSVKLEGYATKKVPTAPASALNYRFLYSLDNVNFSPVTSAQMEGTPLKVATRQITWNGTTAFQDVVIDINQPASAPDSIPADNYPNPIPDHILNPDANGWVRVDQPALDNGFYGALIYLNTNTIIGGGDAGAGLTAGDGVSAADQKNGKMLYLKFQTTDDPANPASTHLNTQSLIGKIYVNNWNEVNLLKLEELFANGGTGCTPVKTQAHVDYTADHELMESWAIGISSAAIGTVANLPAGNIPRGGSDKLNLATAATLVPQFATWPSCAYSLTLSTVRKLTTGEYNDQWKTNQVIFCR